MNSSSSGGRLERFFTGKGFYIVLFLCAAVIGVSAWMMAAGNEAMSKERTFKDTELYSGSRTVVIPASVPEDSAPVMETVPEEVQEVIAPEETVPETAEVMAQSEPAVPETPEYVWPVSGDIDRAYHIDQLRYDETMCDWRTHDGIDIEAPIGASVLASRSGNVESIVEDDLYGTVLTLDHGDGTRSVYAGLSDITAVQTGQYVETGSIIGTVGGTAICESAQEAHLHFAMQRNGVSADPLAFLNA